MKVAAQANPERELSEKQISLSGRNLGVFDPAVCYELRSNAAADHRCLGLLDEAGRSCANCSMESVEQYAVEQ